MRGEARAEAISIGIGWQTRRNSRLDDFTHLKDMLHGVCLRWELRILSQLHAARLVCGEVVPDRDT